MELSVTPQSTIKRSTKIIAFVFVVWLIPTLMLLNLSLSHKQSLEQIEELGIRVSELRQTLYFSEPLRVSRVNDMALDAQLVYSLRLQIESDFKNAWIRPDVNQLLYVVDQFLEKFNEFTPIESQVQYLVDDIKMLRNDPNTSDQLLPLLNQFGTVVFQAMYSDNHTSSSIYRAFDDILEQSYQLGSDEQDALQQLLADASSLLGDYAQLNYLVDRIKKNSVNEQIIALENQYHSGQFYMLLSLAILSVFAFVSLVLIRLKTQAPEQQFDSLEPKVSEMVSEPSPLQSAEAGVLSDQQDHRDDVAIFVANPSTPTAEKSNIGDAVAEKNLGEENLGEDNVLAVSNNKAVVSDSTSVAPQTSVEADVISKDNSTPLPPVAPMQQKSEIDTQTNPVNHPVIDIDEMLETLDGDHESVVLLLNVFIEDHANDFEKFMQLKGEDEVTATRVVHSLKGVAGSIKASRLAVIATSVEANMKYSKPIEDDDLKELELAIEKTVEAARAHLQQSG